MFSPFCIVYAPSMLAIWSSCETDITFSYFWGDVESEIDVSICPVVESKPLLSGVIYLVNVAGLNFEWFNASLTLYSRSSRSSEELLLYRFAGTELWFMPKSSCFRMDESETWVIGIWKPIDFYRPCLQKWALEAI